MLVLIVRLLWALSDTWLIPKVWPRSCVMTHSRSNLFLHERAPGFVIN